MSRMKMVCALMVCVLATPAAAGAQEGNGPYAPFPSAPDGGSGDAWYALMDADVPSAQLGDGAFAGALRPAAAATPGAASARAGSDVAGTGSGAAIALAVVAAGAVGGAAVVRRRRTPGVPA